MLFLTFIARLAFILFFSLICSNYVNSEEANNILPSATEADIFAYQIEIVNRHDFNYIFNPEYNICGKDGEKLFLLIYVHTAPINFKRRQSIRDTWARRSMFRDIRLVFMMGQTTDFKAKEYVKLESGIYNDIVMEDFVDSYKNLTYKGKKKVFLTLNDDS